MHTNRILVSYAEIALKGRNRRDFEIRLRQNIKHRLAREGIRWTVHRGHDRVTVRAPAGETAGAERAAELVRQVAGVASAAPAVFLAHRELRDGDGPPDIVRLETIVLGFAETSWRPDATFAVRVRRGDKGFPFNSDQLARRLGARIIERTCWSTVNLRQPDQSFHVDIYPEGIYLYHERRRGVGGLPVGSGGHVLALLSGGIDSPVAAWMMAKRGCRVDLLHMTAGHVRPEQSAGNLVSRLAGRLSHYTLRSRLYLVPYTFFDMALTGHPAGGYEMILFRRFMARVASRIAGEIGAGALVAGDSLGQVASQTLENMVSTSRATELPILRPLVGLDKQEIIDRARDIDTFELSTEPYKDCCALLSRNPRTRSVHRHLSALEEKLLPNYDHLIATTLAEALVLEFDCGKPARLPGASPAAAVCGERDA